MRVSAFIVSGAAMASALDFQSVKRSITDLIARKDGGSGSCPAIWTTVSAELTKKFLETDGTWQD